MDDDTYVPQLDDEWLSPKELTLWQIEQAERRERGDNKLSSKQFKLPPEQFTLPNQPQVQEAQPSPVASLPDIQVPTPSTPSSNSPSEPIPSSHIAD